MSRKRDCICLSALLALLFLTLTFTGCKHRPLEEMQIIENIFVKVYFDEEIRNVSYGFYDENKRRPEYNSPQSMRVMFYDYESGKLVTERYLNDCGEDEEGYYIQGLMGVPEGRYNILAYNFDTKETKTKNDDIYAGITAYTQYLSDSEVKYIFSSRSDANEYEEPVHRQPDHTFTARVEDFRVEAPGPAQAPDTLKTKNGKYPVAKTMVKSYYFQFNVKGVEYVRSAVALITGMAGSKNMHKDEMIDDDIVSIYFGLNNGKEKRSIDADENTVAYATFNTFGKLPHTEGYIDVTFEFKTIYNTVQTETFHVTDMFETEQVKEKQWIIIEKIIEIIPPEGSEGGGMTPGVNDWEEIEGSITI